MSKKNKRHIQSNQHIVLSSNTTQKDSSVMPSTFGRSIFEKVNEGIKKAHLQVQNSFQHPKFSLSALSKINIEVFDGLLVEWRNRFTCVVGNVINERTIIGALIIKECYSFSDKELIEKLSSDPYLRDALKLYRKFDSIVFTDAYVSFGKIVFKHYKETSQDIVSESLMPIAHNGKIKLRIFDKDVEVDSHLILQQIIYKNIYRQMYKALDKFYKNKKASIDYKIINQINELISLSYDDIIFASTPIQLLSKLEDIGEVSFTIIRRLKVKQGNESQLKNCFDKYYKLVNNKVSLKEISFTDKSVKNRISEIIGALQNRSTEDKLTKEVSINSHSKVEYHFPDTIPSDNVTLLLSELHKINERISTIEHKVESMNKTIEHQFNTLTPFEKQLSRLESLYKNIDGLDNRIILQEESLKSMVEKHLQITLYTQELSKTTKDVYELMKLVLMDSIISKTKI